MDRIPELDLMRIYRYAAERVPLDLQDQIRMEVDIRGKTVTIVECRPPWPGDSDPEWSRQGVARIKFDGATGKWTLYWSDSNDRFHIFDLIGPSSIGRVLREIDDDRTCIFWG